MTCIPPHVVAEADQLYARRDDELTALVDNFRTHAAMHDGDILCARAAITLIAGGVSGKWVTAELLAAAVARIAREAT